MQWLGHQDSEMVAHYFHMNHDEGRRRMAGLDFVGGVDGRSADVEISSQSLKEDVEPTQPERSSVTAP
jgi:hypothetical protein